MTPRSKRCIITCCILIATILLLLILTMVILYFTLLKPKQPEVVATPVSIRSIRFGLFPVVTLQLTLGIEVSIRNRNYAGFKYANTTTSIYYRGGLVGLAPIEAGEVRARSTQSISATVGLLVDKMAVDPKFLPDLMAGRLNLTSESKMDGDVILVKVFKLHASTSVECGITVFVKTKNSTSSCVANIKI